MIRTLQFSGVLVGLALFTVGLAGCSDSGPATVPVNGTLTIDGQPANNLSITFSPVDQSLPTATGTVTDGSFELFCGIEGAPGAVPGKYKVVLAETGGGGTDYMTGGGGGGPPTQELTFPKKYSTAGTSDKEVEVTAGSPDIQIEITSGS